jgi:hypothetical protein
LPTSIKVDWFSLKNGPHQLLSKRHHEADASSITCSASASEAVGSGDHAPVDPGLGTVRKTENMTEQVEYVVVGAGIVVERRSKPWTWDNPLAEFSEMIEEVQADA